MHGTDRRRSTVDLTIDVFEPSPANSSLLRAVSRFELMILAIGAFAIPFGLGGLYELVIKGI